MGPQNHNFLFEVGIRPLHQADHILRGKRFAIDVGGDRCFDFVLRVHQKRKETLAHITRNNDDGNLRVFGTIHRAHGNDPCGQVVPECFGESGDFPLTPIRRVLNDDDTDGALGF